MVYSNLEVVNAILYLAENGAKWRRLPEKFGNFGDDSKGVAAVIDPRADVAIYLRLARKRKVSITHVFETHIHADLVSGSPPPTQVKLHSA